MGGSGADDQVRTRPAHCVPESHIFISATLRTSSTRSLARSPVRWPRAIASSCAALVPFRSSTGQPVPAAIHVRALMLPSTRSRCRSSRPARKCVNGSTGQARSRVSGSCDCQNAMVWPGSSRPSLFWTDAANGAPQNRHDADRGSARGSHYRFCGGQPAVGDRFIRPVLCNKSGLCNRRCPCSR